jgi:ADP-heptose:LPS heptosyltransferase
MKPPDAELPRAELLSSLPQPPHAQRILVIRLGALGDIVRTRFAFPGLRALYPNAQIDWLVEDRAAAGLTGIVGLDGVVQVPRSALRWRHPRDGLRRLSRLIGELRASRYDLALDFHGILKSALLAWQARVPVRVGYERGLAREGSSRFMTHRVAVRSTHLSRFERNAALLRFLGGEVPSTGPPPLRLPAEARALGEGLPEEPVILHPGTSPTTRYKRWDPARYAEVALQLRERVGAPSLVTWGPVPGERESAEAVVRRAQGAATLAPHTGSIAALLALLSRARIFIGSDSGPMHLACLAGAPVVVMFGPTDPLENGPFPGVPSRVLRHDVGCNPCRRGCPALPCMGAVEVEEVVKAALELVAARSPVD